MCMFACKCIVITYNHICIDTYVITYTFCNYTPKEKVIVAVAVIHVIIKIMSPNVHSVIHNWKQLLQHTFNHESILIYIDFIITTVKRKK